MLGIDLKNKLAEINQQVEPVINELLAKDVEEKNAEVALYQCRVGGKRIRPALVVLSGQLFGAKVEDLVYPAASIEILHNSTLIVDDIIDHSDFRRDEPTCWNKYGKSIAECAAFMYLSSVYSGLAGAINGPRLVDLYSRTLKVIIDGEIKDILFERSGREDEGYVAKNRYEVITKDDYLDMISKKTAVLLQTCCQAGAIIAHTSEDQVKTVGDFGYNLGMAFQIRDDILDIFGDEKEFGKKIGKDIIEKKMGNFVILSAVEQMNDEDNSVVCRILEGPDEVSDEDVVTVTRLIEKTNARQTAEEVAESYIDKAFKAIEMLPVNEYSTSLREIAEYIINRDK